MAIPVWCEPDNDGPDDVWVPMNNPGWEANALWALKLTEQIDGLSTTNEGSDNE